MYGKEWTDLNERNVDHIHWTFRPHDPWWSTPKTVDQLTPIELRCLEDVVRQEYFRRGGLSVR